MGAKREAGTREPDDSCSDVRVPATRRRCGGPKTGLCPGACWADVTSRGLGSSPRGWGKWGSGGSGFARRATHGGEVVRAAELAAVLAGEQHVLELVAQAVHEGGAE